MIYSLKLNCKCNFTCGRAPHGPRRTIINNKIRDFQVLQEFEIPKSHVLCCVTDNASNMVKLIKDLNTDQRAAVAADSASEGSSGTNGFKIYR